MNNRWGLVKDCRCSKCGGNIEVILDQYGKDVKCMMCGTPYNDEVPGWLLEELAEWKLHSYKGVPRLGGHGHRGGVRYGLNI